MTAHTIEEVVLLDEHGNAVGTCPKSEVHNESTPLHLAFSCYVIDESGRVLVTKRALRKETWPGAWTNSCCGHPAPGESVEDAGEILGDQPLSAVAVGDDNGVEAVTRCAPLVFLHQPRSHRRQRFTRLQPPIQIDDEAVDQRDRRRQFAQIGHAVTHPHLDGAQVR